MKITKLAFALVFSAGIIPAAALAAWPGDKPIEVIVGFSAGGGTDLMARRLAPVLQKHIGSGAKVVVVNKPGAGGEIASAHIMNAKADGYNIGIVNLPGYLYLPMVKDVLYKPQNIRLLGRVIVDSTIFLVKNDSPFKTLSDVVAKLKSAPESVAFGFSGNGTNGDLAIQLLAQQTQVKPNAIPFKGTSEQKANLLGGHLDIAVYSAGEAADLYGGKQSDVRVLAILSQQRLAVMPQAATAAESGVDIFMSSERGFAAPADMPAGIFARLEAALGAAARDPAFAASSPADAPLISYLDGGQWTRSMEDSKKAIGDLVKARKQ